MSIKEVTPRKTDSKLKKGNKEWRDASVATLAALAENQDSVPRTHIITNNHLLVKLQGDPTPSLAFLGMCIHVSG